MGEAAPDAWKFCDLESLAQVVQPVLFAGHVSIVLFTALALFGVAVLLRTGTFLSAAGVQR